MVILQAPSQGWVHDMARHRRDRTNHEHDYDVLPTAGGLVRLVCRQCGQIGVGLTEEFVASDTLGTEDARSILRALAGPAETPWPEDLSS